MPPVGDAIILPVPKVSGPGLPAARAILGHAIDYAGLFPPASLALTDVLSNYTTYLASGDRWALGRLVVPAGRLHELGEVEAAISVSALIGAAVEDDLEAVTRFNREQLLARVESVELRAGSPAEALVVLALVPVGLPAYLEIPVGEAGDALLDLAAARGRHAKVRTGGTSPDAFPGPDALAHFLAAAARRRVAFKATAGLHHPLRGDFRLTYDADAARGTMYGYLNLVLAALAAWVGRPARSIRLALVESDRTSLRLVDDAVIWRDDRFSTADIEAMRKDFFHSFGSCSFREPLDEWPLDGAA